MWNENQLVEFPPAINSFPIFRAYESYRTWSKLNVCLLRQRFEQFFAGGK